jgi:SAM-dependent methyltransferase
MRGSRWASGRRLAARIANGAANRLDAIGRRLSDHPDPATAGPPPPASRDIRYENLWKPTNASEARRQILTHDDLEHFETTGEEEMVRLVPYITTESRVVDLGCGAGRIAYYIAPLCGTLWAVDVSPEMLGFARDRLARFTNVRYARCQQTRVPDIADGSVDFIYSIIVLQHLEREDAVKLVKDCVRMLRPGGRAFLTWPNLLDSYYLDAFMTYVENGEVANPARARMYTTTELECVLSRVGFSEVTILDGPNIVTVCTR